MALKLGDGVFDKLTNVEITKSVWDNARQLMMRPPPSLNIHALCGESVDLSLRASVMRRSIDNVTGVFISLRNFKKHIRDFVRRYRYNQKGSATRYASEGAKSHATPNRTNKSRTIIRGALECKRSGKDDVFKSTPSMLRNAK